MNKQRVLFLALFLVLVSFSTGYAAEPTTTQINVITLEQAKSLVKENSRSLKKYQINVDKAKYQEQQANYDYYDAIDKYNGEDYSKIESASDNIDNAENNYDDAIKDEENYLKQIDYLVEEIYTSLLNQEETMLLLKKEYELRQNQLNVERQKLALGTSSQYEVDELSASLNTLNKKIIDQTNSIQTNKGQFNDMMGRSYNDELQIAPFEVSTTVELPEYETLLSNVTSSYDLLSRLKRDLKDMEDELDYDEDDFDYYEYLVLRQEIKSKELELADEKNNLNEIVNNLLADLTSKQQDYQLASTNCLNAQKSYDWAKKRYELGQLAKLDLLESELNFLNAKNQRISAGNALYLSQGKIRLAAEGILVN
ncbi:hypothetical protein JCM14036_31460 [Desulfotomaculum defluvii]